MEIEFAFLADAAQAPSGSKLYVLGGGIDELAASAFPAIHPQMVLVLKLKVHPTECNRPHKLEVEFWDPDGRRLGPAISGEFAAQRDETNPTRPRFVQLLFNIAGLQLPAPGDYDFHIVVDGQQMKTVPLYVYQARAPGPSGADGQYN
jgi:hypothetical protein